MGRREVLRGDGVGKGLGGGAVVGIIHHRGGILFPDGAVEFDTNFGHPPQFAI